MTKPTTMPVTMPMTMMADGVALDGAADGLDVSDAATLPSTAPGRARRKTPTAVARPAPRGMTVSAAIHRDLRNEIVTLKRKPGEPIVEKMIAQDYGVSRTPVREAVLRLADEGLIEIFPQSGTFVSRIPLGALPEAIAIRRALEEAMVRYAAERATGSQIAAMRANLELQRETEAAGNFEGFHLADEAFHALVAEASGYPGFWTVTQQVKVQVDRYRRLTLPVLGRMPAVIQEHVMIIDAIAARDPAAAARALRTHLDDLQITIARARETNPLYFTTADDV